MGNTEEYYVKDATGNTMATYSKGGATVNGGNMAQTETHVYGSSRLGILTSTVDCYNGGNGPKALGNAWDATRTAGNMRYEMTDARGNVLLTVTDRLVPVPDASGTMIDHNLADVVSATDYSSFGAPLPGRTFGSSTNGFNGQRKSTEIGFAAQTAGFWEYNGDVGRRWNVDPVYKNSPYEVFGGNPIFFADPNGADSINLTRTTVTQKMGSIKSHLDNYPSKKIADIVTKTGSINIKADKGENIFSVTDVNTTIDENGNSISTSKTTILNLNDEQNYYMTGGHNMKGEIDDRYALAKAAPAWLLNYYAGKSAGWEQKGIQSAIAYQKDLPFASALNSTMNAIYTVSGVYGIAKFGLVAALESKTINIFGARGGYGLFGEEGITFGNYKLEALYSNAKGTPGGTLLSIKQMTKGGNLLRWDYGALHGTAEMGFHSSFRFNVFGNTYGSTAQYGIFDPFTFWKFKRK